MLHCQWFCTCYSVLASVITVRFSMSGCCYCRLHDDFEVNKFARWSFEHCIYSLYINNFTRMLSDLICVVLKGVSRCYIALNRHSATEPRDVTCRMGSRSVTCRPTQVNAPRFNPSNAGRYSIYVPRRDRRLSWPKQLVFVGSFVCSFVTLTVICRAGLQVRISWNFAQVFVIRNVKTLAY